MGRVSEILLEEEDPGLVLSAAKEARELYTKLNGSSDKKFADEDINKMDQRELEEFIRRNSNVINKLTSSDK
jgi:hypothetical protein